MIKKIKTYFLCIFLLGLFGSMGTALAADPVWMVEEEDTYTYQVTYFDSEDNDDVKGEFVVYIEDIDSDDILTYSIDFDDELEGNNDWYDLDDIDDVETEFAVYMMFFTLLILNNELYDDVDYEDYYDDYEEMVEYYNDEEDWDVTISGSSEEKSYDITLSGTDEEGEDVWANEKMEWTTEGVLKESSYASNYIDEDGDEYEYENTIKLKSFTIPGFSLGFFSIAMVLGVTSLLVLRKRTN